MEFSVEYFTETLLCYIFAFCYYHLLFCCTDKHNTLAEKGKNLISTQPRISAHSQGPKNLVSAQGG